MWKTNFQFDFRDLLLSHPLLVATVAAHNSDGTNAITWPASGQSFAVRPKAYVQGYQIQDATRDLPLYEFEG